MRGVLIYERSNSETVLAAIKSEGCKVYVRRLTPSENVAVFEGSGLRVTTTKLRLFMAEFKDFHERRCSERKCKR